MLANALASTTLCLLSITKDVLGQSGQLSSSENMCYSMACMFLGIVKARSNKHMSASSTILQPIRVQKALHSLLE